MNEDLASREARGQVGDGRLRETGGRCRPLDRPFGGPRPQVVGARRPFGQEVRVLPALGEDHVQQAEGQRAVTTGPWGQVHVRRPRGLRADRVDADDGGAPFAGLQEVGPEVQVRRHHVGAPGHDEIGLGDGLDVRGRPPRRIGEPPRPGAGGQADGAVHVGRAESVEEPAVHRRALQLAHRAHVRVRQDGQRPVVVDGSRQTIADRAERFVPRRLTELTATLGSRADERPQQPVRVVGPLLVALHLHAEVAGGDRVVLHAVDAGGDAVGHGDRPRARVGAVVRAGARDWIVVIACSSPCHRAHRFTRGSCRACGDGAARAWRPGGAGRG